MLKHRDVVQIITTKRIRFVSGPAGQAANPNGNWSIIGFISGDAIIAKDKTLVRAPVGDLRKVASFSTESFNKELKSAGLRPKPDLSVPAHISMIFGIDIAKARRILESHNFKLTVESSHERDEITNKIARIIENDKSKT